jgi:hypothetical protein
LQASSQCLNVNEKHFDEISLFTATTTEIREWMLTLEEGEKTKIKDNVLYKRKLIYYIVVSLKASLYT